MDKVSVYIDGFNLYNGLKAKHGRKFLWLDLDAVSQRLLRPGQQRVAVRYFTASVRNDPPAQARQNAYIGALRAATTVSVELGRFQEKHRTCFQCASTWRTYEEKETDVNIAVAMIEDGVNERFDTAIVMSADSDLCPAVRALGRLRPQKRVVAVFPPKRRSDDLRRVVQASFTLGDAIIRQSQLPPIVHDASGVTYRRPPHWA
jgi:uncharacterized LabA/DUF88 family protein